MNLREQVEELLPNWERWYPSLFDAAQDLGIIKAEVCAPSSLLLSNRHSRIQSAAKEAHREKWGGVELTPPTSRSPGAGRRKKRKRKPR